MNQCETTEPSETDLTGLTVRQTNWNQKAVMTLEHWNKQQGWLMESPAFDVFRLGPIVSQCELLQSNSNYCPWHREWQMKCNGLEYRGWKTELSNGLSQVKAFEFMNIVCCWNDTDVYNDPNSFYSVAVFPAKCKHIVFPAKWVLRHILFQECFVLTRLII